MPGPNLSPDREPAEILRTAGFPDVAVLRGGMQWNRAGLPIEVGSRRKAEGAPGMKVLLIINDPPTAPTALNAVEKRSRPTP
jgi:3-mercaptopyruvate sulfurtransferase SseA